MRNLLPLVACVAVWLGFTASGCKGPMARIEQLRDGLVSGEPAAVARAVEGLPSCPDAPPVALLPNEPSPLEAGCLSAIANALGSTKGFVPRPPDQAAAATGAVLLVRDHRGDRLAHADDWLSAMKSGKGSGLDTLRLATARAMAEAAPRVGRAIDDERTAADTLAAIAGAIPGACPTYALLGSGKEARSLPAELTADHAACVQRDLKRRDGMGPSYGEGTFRALEGALALWRDAERALRLGLGVSAAATRTRLEAELTVIEAATQKNVTRKIPGTQQREVLQFLGDLHADAGVALFRPDAGASARADAGAPKTP